MLNDPTKSRSQRSDLQILWATRSSATIEVPLLDPGESQHLCGRIMGLSSHFRSRSRSPLGNLKTLGLASYLDASTRERRAGYIRGAPESNALLVDGFEALYRMVTRAIAVATGRPAFLTPRYAVPGFHVFDPFTYKRADLKPPHFDTQYTLLDPDYRLTPDNTQHHLTITLLLAEPPGGAFIEYYDQDFQDRLSDAASAPGTAGKPAAPNSLAASGGPRIRKTHRYSVGRLVLTVGMPLHQIWPLMNEAEPGLRLSLQGHGVLHRKGWELFW